MIKFSEKQEPKNDYGTSNVNNVISEYLGSRIFASTGIPTHETLLGTYDGELVVACKNFLRPGETLHEFAWYLRNQYDSKEIKRTPAIEQIYRTIAADPDLSRIKTAAIERFWDSFVVDAVIGNFDRHSEDWGYIVGTDDSVRPAPVYDCGGCLYPGLSTDATGRVLDEAYGTARRIFEFPKAALLVDGKKVGYYDMMASGYDRNCSEAVLRMAPRINMGAVREIVNETSVLSKERKEFCCETLAKRLEMIVERAYERASRDDLDEVALGRIGTDAFKTKEETMEEFERGKAELEEYRAERVDEWGDSVG